jgi:alpha/beta superfamily hydrolase
MKLLNQIFQGAEGRKTLIDVFIPTKSKCFVLFIHGYKGFKDWGCWNLVANHFYDRGIAFAKFNFSHNGGTIEEPLDFPDLEAFARNRYTYELFDSECAINWLKESNYLTSQEVILIGHSRGGAISILSSHLPEITKIITWASISNIENRFPKGSELENWKSAGVRYVENARTHQKMPHYISFYEDWIKNKNRLLIENVLNNSTKSFLHIHGTMDEAVGFEDSKKLANWSDGNYIEIEGANHTFGSSHPWHENKLPNYLKTVCEQSIQFILQ